MDDLEHLNHRLQQGIVLATERNMLRVSEALADLAAALSSEADRPSYPADASQETTAQLPYVAPMIQKITA
jgi:hypothetical protein